MRETDWQAVVDEYGRCVWMTVYRLLRNDTDTADCFQETFVCALELSRNEKIRDFGAILKTIATRRAINQLKKNNRRQRSNINHTDCDQIEVPNGNPTQRAEQLELADCLADALGKIGSEEAAVFCLRYLSDMSYIQISRELDIGLSKTGVLLHRAKKKLRVILQNAGTTDYPIEVEK